MTCYRPVTCWKPDEGGPIAFHETRNSREIEIPCGRCIGCRIDKQRDWSTRCQHEAACHLVNSFITLTYEGDQINPSLNYGDFQHFMRKLRREHGPTRFFMCGEYGALNRRPHFHALLFGRTFGARQQIGAQLWRSAELESLWDHGYSSIGDVNKQTCNYVARYATKKMTGPAAEEHYKTLELATGEIIQLKPEFAHMSLRPGIGEPWLKKYWREVYGPRDGVTQQGGKTTKAPRYYDKKLKEWNGEITEKITYNREKKAIEHRENNTTERLKTREKVEIARLKHTERNKL